MIYLNGQELPIRHFYGGELTALVSRLLPHNKIVWLWDDKEGAAELFILQALMATMKNKGVAASLDMPYIPYARNDGMDDFMENSDGGEPIYRIDTLSALTDTINSLGFTEVSVVEPHSAVAPKLLQRSRVTEITPTLVENCLEDLKDSGIDTKRVLFIFPDGGAEKRYSRKLYYNGKPWVGTAKRRDPKTGRLEGYNFFNLTDSLREYNTAIIVDDICGRGGTYLPLAASIREQGFKATYLIVAHCENNIHTGTVLSGGLISKVYTTDSILTVPHENLVVAHRFAPKQESLMVKSQ